MALLDAFLQDGASFNIWMAARSDGIAGSGTARNPFNGAARRHPETRISLKATTHPSGREAEATVISGNNVFFEGDVVEISGVIGQQTEFWNGTFGIYNVSAYKFNYLIRRVPLAPQGSPVAVRLTFPFDEVMRTIPPNTRIHLGPGLFQTRGFAPNDPRGFQAKSGWKMVGSGIDVTTLQLVGAENADQHYHVIGMPIEPSGSSPITPLEWFEISDLTIDCNLDNQPGRPSPGYANVACGAVRILGNRCRVRARKHRASYRWLKEFREPRAGLRSRALHLAELCGWAFARAASRASTHFAPANAFHRAFPRFSQRRISQEGIPTAENLCFLFFRQVVVRFAEQFGQMLLEPLRQAPAVFRRQSQDGRLELLQAHGAEITRSRGSLLTENGPPRTALSLACFDEA